MAAIDVVNRVLREFRRYTGDGLPGEPVNAPLPVGDPQSGIWNPKKADLRQALLAPIDAAAQSASDADEDRALAQAAADRAENAAASVISAATNFKTVAVLLSDTTMGYVGSGAVFEVAPGDIVNAQGFRYEVAASDATDAHVETSGGVKLFPTSGNVLAFGADPTDINHDDVEAFEKCHAAFGGGVVPDGDFYYFSRPMQVTSRLALKGSKRVTVIDATWNVIEHPGARIYAPNGFVVNPLNTSVSADRKDLELYGIGVIGGEDWEVEETILIKGRFRALIDGCAFAKFHKAMENNAAFLSQILNNWFEQGNWGIDAGTANGLKFENNSVSGNVQRALDTDNPDLDMGVGGASQDSLPVIVTRNNFNGGSRTIAHVRVNQMLVHYGNYYEAFAGIVGNNDFVSHVEYRAKRFGKNVINSFCNEMNGGGRVDRAWSIASDNTSGALITGFIDGEAMVGYNERPILIDDATNLVFGPRIGSIRVGTSTVNILGDAPTVDYTGDRAVYNPTIDAGYAPSSPGIDVSGGTFVTIPFSDNSGNIGGSIAGAWTCLRRGRYSITATAEHRVSANTQLAEVQLQRLDQATSTWVPLDTSICTILTGSFASARSQVTLSFEGVINRNDQIRLQARNGGTIIRAKLNIAWYGEASYS